ncbi:ribose operon repressor [Burkholderia pseudomallei]|uniref:LacI family DNA-binding transcriptional regulator n=1 Tax=Burkholderia pseudomallei TaxID=28450 RepID=UPI000F087FBE|nr:substrate-binding domain-containing protein [Burkholderia pseudomallei]CAJ2816772.1 ribose operon repressor [Burkholderia pseudomallei]VCD15350.1 ribose operon repressor [Burkholderia pseudomallei]VCD19187.1 ribose operon repressor [Burkholderia pseudomallei]VCD27659.1 ribose operon repressor [Burkholderia pseudomallei]VCD28039.1 ribose operon repressor [Burkholderia pseudomallei]
MGRKSHSHTVTLKDVAREAEVSYQTVSRAINGYDEISAETREKVLDVCRRLGYRPNRLAGSLRSKRSNVVGLIVSDIENVFFAEVASGVESEARHKGYSVLLANTAEDIVREREAVGQLFERRVDGLILAPSEGEHDYLRTELPKTFPIVAVNRELRIPGCGAVLSENVRGARTAVEYLIARGHTRIGAIVGSAGLMTSRERLKGFRAAMSAAGLPVRQEWIAAGGVRADNGRDGAIKVLTGADRPTALLTSSHRITEGAMQALNVLGLRYGQDVEIVSFDNLPWMAFLDPPLPVVEQPTRRIGQEAMRMLIHMIEGTGNATEMRLQTRFVTHVGEDLSVEAE